MEKPMVKAVSSFLAGMLCVSVFSMSAFAERQEAFEVRDVSSGYAIAGIRESAITDGQVVIPDEIDGILVIQLGAQDKTGTFLGQYGVTRLVIGKNVRGATTTAFYGANDLREIEISQENKGTLAFDSETGVLKATAGGNGILVKYLSGNERKSYRVPEGIGRSFNIDHAKFDTAGSTLYGSDGDALWHEGRLVKVAAGAEFPDGYFDRFDSISPYAFHSIAQYQNLKAKLPEKLTKDVVFSFYHQNAAVFMVNGEISFCYDHDLGVPNQVGDPVDYSQDIDAEKCEKVKALMYVGVPYDGTGLFKQVFGMEYGEISCDAQAMEHGDAALNTVSCMLYEILDGVSPDEIR